MYVNGFLHSYKKNNQTIYYISPKLIKVLDKDFNLNKETYPMIDYDTDGVMLWNGQRCESTPMDEETRKEMEDFINEFR